MRLIWFYVALCQMTLESNLFPQSSVKLLAVLDLACYWLQLIKKLSENCHFFCIRHLRLEILLLFSKNECGCS